MHHRRALSRLLVASTSSIGLSLLAIPTGVAGAAGPHGPAVVSTYTVSGEVHRADTHGAYLGVTVELTHTEHGELVIDAETTTDGQGAFDLHVPPGDRYTLRYNPDDNGPDEIGPTFAVQGTRTLPTITAPVYTYVTVTGTVADRSGSPLPGATVDLWRNDASDCFGCNTPYAYRDHPRRTTTSDDMGHYLFDHIRIGSELDIEAGKLDYQPSTAFGSRWVRNDERLDCCTLKFDISHTTAPDIGLPGDGVHQPQLHFTRIPKLRGTVKIGHPLATNAVYVKVAPHVAEPVFTWLRDGRPIRGREGADLSRLPTRKDAGHRLSLQVSATERWYRPGQATSQQVLVPFPEIHLPKHGIRVGARLTFLEADGGSHPSVYSHARWLRDGKPIRGANGLHYVPTAQDAGHQLSVRSFSNHPGFAPSRVTRPRYVKGPLHPAAAASRPARSAPGFVVRQDVSVYGWPGYDERVRVVGGRFAPAPDSVSYQWLRDGSPILGATADNYVLTPDDPNHTLTVQATAHRAGYAAATSTSRPELVTYDSSPYSYSTLTGHVLTSAGAPQEGVTVDLWLVTGRAAGRWTDARVMEGATTDPQGAFTMYGVPSDTRLVLAATRSGAVRTASGATSVYDDPGFTTAAPPTDLDLSFDGTEPTPVADPLVQRPVITGAPEVGRTVTLAPATWRDPVSQTAIHWRLDDHTVAGAIGTTLPLGVDDLGSKVQACLAVFAAGPEPTYSCTSRVVVARATVSVRIAAPRAVAVGVHPVVTVRVTSRVARGGLLDILDRGRQVATARVPLADDGVVHLRLPILAKGLHRLRIRYSGDRLNHGAVSPVVRVRVS